jgi:hypothetical protein
VRSFSASCGLPQVPHSHSRLPVTGSVPAETLTSQAFPRWTTLPRSRLSAMIGKLLVNIPVNRHLVPPSHDAGTRR